MPPALEFGYHPRRDDLANDPVSEHAAPQNENVGIVVQTRHASGGDIVHERCAHTRNLVGRDRHSDPGPAQQDSSSRLSRRNSLPDFHRIIGIVDRLGAVRPEVANFATETVECIDDYSLGGHRGVIACNGDYRFRFAF